MEATRSTTYRKTTLGPRRHLYQGAGNHWNVITLEHRADEGRSRQSSRTSEFDNEIKWTLYNEAQSVKGTNIKPRWISTTFPNGRRNVPASRRAPGDLSSGCSHRSTELRHVLFIFPNQVPAQLDMLEKPRHYKVGCLRLPKKTRRRRCAPPLRRKSGAKNYEASPRASRILGVPIDGPFFNKSIIDTDSAS